MASGLDFFEIKSNIIQYLQNQSEFSDYDFEGSALNVLIDALAYNTHYIGLYANMAFNESFLDSALMRKNIVSRAKEFGYIPKQKTPSVVTLSSSGIQTTYPEDFPDTIIVPKWTRFNSSISNNVYTFLASQDYVLSKSSGYTSSINLIQGVAISDKFTVEQGTRFIIQDTSAATEMMEVSVKLYGEPDERKWSFFQNKFLSLNPESEIFFTQEYNDRIEVYFGDGIIGKIVSNGSVVTIKYIITAGIDSNGASKFILASNLLSTNSITVYPDVVNSNISFTPISKAFGGSDRESTESVRKNAAMLYKAQQRAVTIEDYYALLKNHFTWVTRLNVWGGEDNYPPQYGKVFISFESLTGDSVSEQSKTEVKNYIKQFSIIGIEPYIVDSVYIDVIMDCKIRYNPTITTNTYSELQNIAINAILKFYDPSMNNVYFDMSSLSRKIDESHTAFISNVISYKLSQNIKIHSTSTENYSLTYNVPIDNFYIKDFVDPFGNIHSVKDDGNGILQWYKNGNLIKSVGTINYRTGLVDIQGFDVYVDHDEALNYKTLTSVATTTENDIKLLRSTSLRMKRENLSILLETRYT